MHVRTLGGAAIAGAALLAVLVGGCSSSGGGQNGPEPPLGNVPVITSSAAIPPLPLDAYQETTKPHQDAIAATGILARRCMSRYGFDWHGSDDTEQPDLDRMNLRRYGIIDADLAARQGYRWDGQPTVGTNATGNVHPSQAAINVFVGTVPAGTLVGGQPVPAGGCSGEADRILDAGVTPVPGNDQWSLHQRLSDTAYSKAKADSRVVGVFASWSTCMAKRGFHYATPDDANNDPQWSVSNQATPTEIATASADFACKIQTNLVGTWYAVEAAYDNQLIEQNAQQLALVKQHIDGEARNAAKVLSGS